jgi:hypothetical protein
MAEAEAPDIPSIGNGWTFFAASWFDAPRVEEDTIQRALS